MVFKIFIILLKNGDCFHRNWRWKRPGKFTSSPCPPLPWQSCSAWTFSGPPPSSFGNVLLPWQGPVFLAYSSGKSCWCPVSPCLYSFCCSSSLPSYCLFFRHKHFFFGYAEVFLPLLKLFLRALRSWAGLLWQTEAA